jgi:hypothetical protein
LIARSTTAALFVALRVESRWPTAAATAAFRLLAWSVGSGMVAVI